MAAHIDKRQGEISVGCHGSIQSRDVTLGRGGSMRGSRSSQRECYARTAFTHERLLAAWHMQHLVLPGWHAHRLSHAAATSLPPLLPPEMARLRRSSADWSALLCMGSSAADLYSTMEEPGSWPLTMRFTAGPGGRVGRRARNEKGMLQRALCKGQRQGSRTQAQARMQTPRCPSSCSRPGP